MRDGGEAATNASSLVKPGSHPAARVMSEGRTRFDDGTWYINVGGAHFHFTQRNRIVVAEDPPAVQLQYSPSSTPDPAPPQ